MPHDLKIIVADYCPFSLRSLLALTAKGLSFDVETVDLEQKASFPEKLSPYQRVPVLEHGAARIFESSIINEYLEDAFPDPPLLPVDPIQRADARFWIDFCDTRFMPAYFNLLKSKPGTQRDEIRQSLMVCLGEFDGALAERQGPEGLWRDTRIGLVDIAFYPFFERFAAVEEFRGVEIPKSLTYLHRWLTALCADPAVRRYSLPRQQHVDFFRPYYEDPA